MTLTEQLSEEVRSNDKYTYLGEVTREELLAFLVSHIQVACLGKNF